MKNFWFKTIVQIIVLALLITNTIITKSYDTTNTIIVLILFLTINKIFFTSKKIISKKTGDIAYITAGTSLIFIGLLYLLGFKTGFNVNYNSIFKNYITTSSWIKVFLIVILTEVLRYQSIISEKQKSKRIIQEIITISIFVFLDISICTKIYDLKIFTQLYEFIALIVIQSTAKNIFLCHIIKKYGSLPCITYRIIMDLYIFFIPMIPSINVYVEGIALLIYPYSLNKIIDSVAERKGLIPSRKRKKENKIINALSYILFAFLVLLVSREFEYAMIAIGSGSMTGTINKGDAIIYKAYNGKENLEAGDIIVFNKDSMLIIHRIVKRYTIYGKEVYQTKGDANETIDSWIVNQEDIIGTVKTRIPLIAWPSVIVNSSY